MFFSLLFITYAVAREGERDHFLADLGDTHFGDKGPSSPTTLWAYCENDKCRVTKTEISSAPFVAKVHFQPGEEQLGFDYVKAEVPKGDCGDDRKKAYMAGFLEGVLTAYGVNAFMHNTGHGRTWRTIDQEHLNALTTWWTNAEATMLKKQDCANMSVAECKYWKQITLGYYQMLGVMDGHNTQVPENERKTSFDFFRINSDGNISDLIDGLYALSQKQLEGKTLKEEHKIPGMGRCSALVKYITGAGGEELFVGHATWEGYSEMVRSWKYYDMDFCDVKAKTVSFSGYPGVVSSTDDYYITYPTHLAVTETTLSNSNGWAHLVDHKVPDCFHTMAVLRLSETGDDFATNLTEGPSNRGLSGMYNSQWMIVDYKKFWENKKDLQPGTLFVVETGPHLATKEDKTNHLKDTTWWGSVNHPASKKIDELLGFPNLLESEMRYKIFEGEAPYVENLADMKKLMRFAKTTARIPVSSEGVSGQIVDLHEVKVSPSDGISARYDLNDIPSAQGGVDCKVVDSAHMQSMEVIVQAGPSYDDLEPFSFKKFGQEVPHHGIPDGPLKWPWMKANANGLQVSIQTTPIVHANDSSPQKKFIQLRSASSEPSFQVTPIQPPPPSTTGQEGPELQRIRGHYYYTVNYPYCVFVLCILVICVALIWRLVPSDEDFKREGAYLLTDEERERARNEDDAQRRDGYRAPRYGAA